MSVCILTLTFPLVKNIDNLNSPPGGPLQVKNFDFNAYIGLLAVDKSHTANCLFRQKEDVFRTTFMSAISQLTSKFNSIKVLC